MRPLKSVAIKVWEVPTSGDKTQFLLVGRLAKNNKHEPDPTVSSISDFQISILELE